MASGQNESVIDSYDFSLAGYTGRDRFDAWAGEVAPLFDVAPAAGAQNVVGAIKGYLLEGVVVARSEFSAQSYSRDRALVARSGLDAYLIQLYTQGGFGGQGGARDMSVAAGDICVFDLTETLATQAQRSAVVNLVIPKLLVDRHWHSVGRDVNGLVIPKATMLGKLMGAHLATLFQAMPTVHAQEAPVVADATARMVASCLSHCTREGSADTAPMRKALRGRAMDYIHANLSSPDLTPANLCRVLNVSRAHLYRAFQETGGVERAIFDQRLRLAFQQLNDPARRSDTIGEIAFRCGFASDAHFARLFRNAFGIRPRDVRDWKAPPAPDGPGLPAWLSSSAFRSPAGSLPE